MWRMLYGVFVEEVIPEKQDGGGEELTQGRKKAE